MVFSRFFKGKDESGTPDSPDTAAEAADESVEGTADEGADAEPGTPGGDVPPEHWEEAPLAERAMRVFPIGSSTGSKRPAALYGEADVAEPHGPTHFIRALGCELECSDGSTLIDCTMALGSVSIGYGDADVTRAVLDAAGAGNTAGLPHTLEIEVAERFCEYVPCAEKVQFMKSGAEAMAAAVRIARTYTARDIVVGCGYFGWHDWASDAAGVPANVQKDFLRVPFDDIAALEEAADTAGSQLAAIVLEPVIERLPSPEWVQRARALADAHGSVLILDEMKTGFRLATGGYQEYAGVTPDLAAFGKAMANGYPLAAVCGRVDLMNAAANTWISSTHAAESTALAAAYVVLELYRERGAAICAQLADTGKEMQRVIGLAIEASGVEGITLGGIDPMWFLRFDSPQLEARFLRRAAGYGVLFKRGPYNFPSLAHDDDAILAIEGAASNALVELRHAMDAE